MPALEPKDYIALGGAIVSVTSAIAAWVGVLVARNQRKLESKRFFTILWPEMVKVAKLDSSNPIVPQVLTNQRTLALVSVCWEAGVVNEAMVALAFTDDYIETYDELGRFTQDIGNLGKTGEELLREYPSIERVYISLKTRRANQGRLPKGG